MTTERLVVIGGDAAGMSAASQARRRRPDLEIVVFERSPHTSYAAWGIPYYVGRVVDESDALIARKPETFRQEYNIDVRILHEVVEVDLRGRRVRVEQVGGERVWWETFDHLLFATGAISLALDVPGAAASGIHTLSTLQSGIVLRQEVDRDQPRRAVIGGGGYIGLEMAEGLLERGIDVSLVEMAPQVMGTLDSDMGALVGEALQEAGVHLYLEEVLQGFEVDDGRVRGVQTDQRTLPADLVILGLGIRPNSALAERAGLPLGERGAIQVSDRMQTAVEGIWAAGDCVESLHLVSRRPAYIALGTVANKQGRVAGINISGGHSVFPGVVGTAATKFRHLEVARTGLQEREARKLGLAYVSARIDERTRARYYPGAGRITVKLLAEKGSGRLLGGQIVGAEGSAKRIDVLATALHAEMSLEEMIHLDLGYAPPFSPVWDPVLTAVRVLLGRL